MIDTSSKVLINHFSELKSMQIDATRYKRLTQEEKDKQQQENLCLYCSEPGHRAHNCPMKISGFKI